MWLFISPYRYSTPTTRVTSLDSQVPLIQFKVDMNGSGFMIKEGSLAFKEGFDTMVFVKGADEQHAIDKAIDLIKHDNKLDSMISYSEDDWPVLRIRKVEQTNEWPEDLKNSRTEYQFYDED